MELFEKSGRGRTQCSLVCFITCKKEWQSHQEAREGRWSNACGPADRNCNVWEGCRHTGTPTNFSLKSPQIKPQADMKTKLTCLPGSRLPLSWGHNEAETDSSSGIYHICLLEHTILVTYCLSGESVRLRLFTLLPSKRHQFLPLLLPPPTLLKGLLAFSCCSCLLLNCSP